MKTPLRVWCLHRYLVHEVHLYFFALSWGSTRVLWTVRGKQCVSAVCPASTAASQSWCTAAFPNRLCASAHSSSSSATPWMRRQGERRRFWKPDRIILKFLFNASNFLFIPLLTFFFPFFGLKSICFLCCIPWLILNSVPDTNWLCVYGNFSETKIYFTSGTVPSSLSISKHQKTVHSITVAKFCYYLFVTFFGIMPVMWDSIDFQ